MANERRVRTNNAQGTTTDNPLSSGATTMNSAGLANLAAIGATEHTIIVLDPLRVAGAPEIVMVTAHTGAATSATITRGYYGTAARSHNSGTLWVAPATLDDLIGIYTSATRPSSPYRGQLIFETDTNSYVGRDTSDAWQTALPLGAWTAYTPTLTQLGAVTKTVTYAKYVRMGRSIYFAVDLSVTGTGTAANDVSVGLPVTAAATAFLLGVGQIYDTSAGLLYNGNSDIVTTTTAKIWAGGASGGPAHFGGSVFTAALAVGDLIRLSGLYEAAS